MTSFQFRSLVEADIPAIVEIEKLSFTTPWTEDAFLYELNQNKYAHYTVMTCGERVAGYCGMWLIIDEAHITNIAVHPEFRGKGLGKRLMIYVMAHAVLKGAHKMTLEVRPTNKVALNLYRQLGFVCQGVRPRYYTDNFEDAWIMWVKLR